MFKRDKNLNYKFTPSFWDRFVRKEHYYKETFLLEELKLSGYLGFLKDIDFDDSLVLKTDLYAEAKNRKDNFLPRLKINRCVGMDISLEVVRIARKNLTQLLPNMKFVVADVRHLPFKEHSFSAVISDSTLDDIPKNDLFPALLEAKRIIKNKGEFILSLNNIFNFPFVCDRVIKNLFFNDHFASFSFSPQYILKLLVNLDFKIIHWDYIIPLDCSGLLLLKLSNVIKKVNPLARHWLSILRKMNNSTLLKTFLCLQFIILVQKEVE